MLSFGIHGNNRPAAPQGVNAPSSASETKKAPAERLSVEPAQLPRRPLRVVDCGRYVPTFVEPVPSLEHSPELYQFTRGTWYAADARQPDGVIFVRQSEGRMSLEGQPLASIRFCMCGAYLGINTGVDKRARGDDAQSHNRTIAQSHN
jgi:hypothetical protein